MKDAISYIRVSSEEQADSGLGLEAQRQRITAYCTMKGLHLAETFEDPGVSAGKPLASRPAGSKLLAAAKKSKAVVVAAKLDRLFRSVAAPGPGPPWSSLCRLNVEQELRWRWRISLQFQGTYRRLKRRHESPWWS
jgi:hypothetical protein